MALSLKLCYGSGGKFGLDFGDNDWFLKLGLHGGSQHGIRDRRGNERYINGGVSRDLVGMYER